MAKSIADSVIDLALADIATATRMVLCSAQPTTFTEANATYALADVTMAPGDFTGPANGTVSGRKITTAAKPGVAVDVTGTATHVALLDVAGTRLLAVTECASVSLDASGTVDIGSFAYEIGDPA